MNAIEFGELLMIIGLFALIIGFIMILYANTLKNEEEQRAKYIRSKRHLFSLDNSQKMMKCVADTGSLANCKKKELRDMQQNKRIAYRQRTDRMLPDGDDDPHSCQNLLNEYPDINKFYTSSDWKLKNTGSLAMVSQEYANYM
jgi:hypothetical protein